MDDVITLIKEEVTGHDAYGNETIDTTERELMCQVYSINRNEFYSAAVANLHPELSVHLSDYEDYEGEKLALYNGVLYSIIRTYRDNGSFSKGSGMSLNSIELILERKVGNDVWSDES